MQQKTISTLDRAAATLVCAPGVCIRVGGGGRDPRSRSIHRSIDPRRVAVIPASRVPIGQFAARFARYRVTKDVVGRSVVLARPPAITHRRSPPPLYRNHGVGRPIRIIDKYRYFSLHAAPGPTMDGKITYE